MHKKFSLCLILLICFGLICQTGFAQTKMTLSGFVREKGSAELLPGVNVSIPNKKIGIATNKYGFYSITIPATDSLTVMFSFIGYGTIFRKIKLLQNVELNISLEPEGISLNEVQISAEKQKLVSETVQMSQVSIPIQQIKEIPAFLGEKDVLKVLQLMPGVQKGSEGNSGIYVRGGGPDQNLLILDDATVYNAYHLFGFFSVFNGDALKSVELTKGGFPARFGGRLSSVIEIQMKDGNKEKIHGEGGIGLISSRFMLEGPIKNQKSSFLVSGRRTYLDALVRPFLPAESQGGYYFYDFNAKLNHEFNSKNKLYASGYFGRDAFSALNKSTGIASSSTVEAGINWGNSTATIRWNHLFNEKLFANTSLIYSNYAFNTFVKQSNTRNTTTTNFSLDYLSSIRDYGVKFDLDYLPSPKHTIRLGALFTQHTFTPSAINLKDASSAVAVERNVTPIIANEGGLYFEDTYRPISNLQINAGLRMSLFTTPQRNYINPEPRVATALTLPNHLAIKASYATMNQYVHLLSNSGLGLPTDLWVPTTSKVAPQQSRQIAIGLAKDLIEKNLSITLEGYYKTMNNILAFKEGTNFLFLDASPDALATDQTQAKTWDEQVTQGKGKSYGAEFLVQRKTGKFSGWVGYTLSWNIQQFDELNGGKEFFAKYDRRHDISVVGIYHFSPKITLSGTWVYGTGNAISLPTSLYYANTALAASGRSFNAQAQNYETRNAFRAAAYHRLDLGVQFHKQKKHHERIWEFSVYNAYNRQNPFFYDFQSTFTTTTQETSLIQYSLFGFIPSFSYSFKF